MAAVPANTGDGIRVAALTLLAASLTDDPLAVQRWHTGVLTGSVAVAPGAPVVLLLTPQRRAALLVVATTSGAFALFNVAATPLRHPLVPGQVLEPVVATWRTAVLGAGALGALVGGILTTAGGLDAPFVLSAAPAPSP